MSSSSLCDPIATDEMPFAFSTRNGASTVSTIDPDTVVRTNLPFSDFPSACQIRPSADTMI